MKTLSTVALMVTVAPMLVVVTMSCIDPEYFGGGPYPLNVLMMTLFAVITVPMWPTYMPAIILAPIVMRRVASLPRFHTLPLPSVLVLSVATGAVAGACVMLPIVLMARPPIWAARWTVAGATSGAVTLALISLVYRYN